MTHSPETTTTMSHLAIHVPFHGHHHPSEGKAGGATGGSSRRGLRLSCKFRSLFIAVVIFFLIGFALLHGLDRPFTTLTDVIWKQQVYVSCDINATEIASRYHLQTPFRYSRRIVQSKPLQLTKVPRHTRPTPHQVEGHLIPGWAKLQGRDTMTTTTASCSLSQDPISLPVYTIKAKTSPASLIVGMATSIDRILLFLDLHVATFAHTGIKLVFVVSPDPRIPSLEQHLATHGLDAVIMPVIVDSDPSQPPNYGKEEFMIRWTLLPDYVQQHMEPSHKWMYLADDDTVLLSLTKLLAMLDRYDVEAEHYIGALSDDWKMTWVGMFAYGGAGTVLSRPLVTKVAPHLTRCSRQHNRGGDERLAHCIYQHTTARLQLELGLNQVDLHGNIQGLLEGSKDLITLHHWRTDVTGFDPKVFALLSNTTYGGQGFLQRYQAQSIPGSGATDLLLVRGISITQFHGNSMPDLEKSELTWDFNGDDPTPFLHALGPLRPPVPMKPSQQESWKQVWALEDIATDDVGNVRELYINRDEAGVDSVIELVWI